MKKLLTSLLISLSGISVFSQNPEKSYILQSAVDNQSITSGIEIFQDDTQSFSLDEIQKPEFNSKFKRDSLYDASKTNWVKITLHNRLEDHVDWYLKSNYNFIAELYQWQNHRFVSSKNGKNVQYSQKDVIFDDHLYHLFLKEGINTFYIKLTPVIPTLLSGNYKKSVLQFLLSKKTAVDNEYISKELVNYLLIGIFIIMILYNFVLFLFIRDKTFLFYVLNLIAVFLFDFKNSVLYFWKPDSEINHVQIVFQLSAGLFAVFYLHFVRYYFNVKTLFPKWNHFYNSLQYVYLLPLLLVVYDFYHPFADLSSIPIAILDLTVLISSFILCIAAVKIKYKPAIYFLIACIPGAFSGTVLFFVFMGEVYHYHIHNWFPFVYGEVIRIVLFPIALASRYNLMQKEIREKQGENEKLDQLNEAKNRLFAIIGHDLRSPINALTGVLSLMEDGILSPEEQTKIIRELRIALSSTYKTLDNLMHWAQIQMNRTETKLEKISLHEIALQNEQLFIQIAQSKGINLENKVAKDVFIYADSNQINLILRNLIANAIKFTHKGGKVTISYELGNNKTKIIIQDTGIGISAENLIKILNKDQNFTTYGTSGEKGTGLGLTLCKEFIEKNGGNIDVTSEIGKGTMFIVSLPNY